MQKTIVLTVAEDDSKICIGIDRFISAEDTVSGGSFVKYEGFENDYEINVKESPEEISKLINRF